MLLFTEALDKLNNSFREYAPRNLKRVEGRSSGPTQEDGRVFDSSSLMSLCWNKDLKWDTDETKEGSSDVSIGSYEHVRKLYRCDS